MIVGLVIPLLFVVWLVYVNTDHAKQVHADDEERKRRQAVRNIDREESA